MASPLTEPESLAADPTRGVIYGVDRDEQLIAYDIAMDSWAVVGATGVASGGKGGLAYDPALDVLYFSDTDGNLYTIDPATALATPVGVIDTVEHFVGLTYSNENPVPDIKANGSDDEITIKRWETLSLTVTLEAGEMAGVVDVEMWILADTPFGWFHYEFGGGGQWLPGENVAFQGSLADLAPTVILNQPLFPGSYRFYYDIDLVVNGVRDSGFTDSVDVIITWF